MRQLSFLPSQPKTHGGSSQVGRRKIMRPFDARRPMHVILKASGARGQHSMLLPVYRDAIVRVRDRAARRHHVKVLSFANVGNHLHLTVLVRKRLDFQGFLREFSGHVAVAMTGAVRGRPARANVDTGVHFERASRLSQRQFWDALAWTRIVSWGQDLRGLQRYFVSNEVQSRARARGAARADVLAFLAECYAIAPPD